MKNLKTYIYKVLAPEDEGLRVDKWLTQFEELGSRSAIIRLIEQGHLLVDGKAVTKTSFPVEVGQELEVTVPAPERSLLTPNHSPLDIVYEDQDLIVINKPSGLVVHPSAGHLEDSVVQRLLSYCDLSPGSELERPGVVHRLDRDTSGLVVLAKNEKTHRELAAQFKAKSTHRIYEAIAYGAVVKESGTIKSYLNRHPVDRKRRASVRDINKKIFTEYMENFQKGKWAVTHYKLLGLDRSGQLSWLELKLETGRTHQIRVHLSEMGHPLVGDTLYGADKRWPRLKGKELRTQLEPLNRVLLHARELGFTHPSSKEPLHFAKPWPERELIVRETLFKGASD